MIAAAGDFAEVTREVSSVSIVIQDLEEQAASPELTLNPQDWSEQVKLRSLIDGIIYPLRELEELATKYTSLSTAKKNNWDRLRFASKKISDIRSRLALHTSIAQNFLDGLANRRVIRIERKSEESNAAISRVERAIADIVRDIKSGSRSSSASDERWNIWTELKRELRVEGYPVEVVQQHRNEIKQYFLNLQRDVGLEDEVLLDDIEAPVGGGTRDQGRDSIASEKISLHMDALKHPEDSERAGKEHNSFVRRLPKLSNQKDLLVFVLRFAPWPFLALLLLLAAAFLQASIEQPGSPFQNSTTSLLQDSPSSTPSVIYPPDPHHDVDELVHTHEHHISLEVKAGVLRNRDPVLFTCSNLVQAQQWIDQLSPLFEAELMDESAIKLAPLFPAANKVVSIDLQANKAMCRAQLLDQQSCPSNPTPLTPDYWDIFSKEAPCGHE